MIGVRRSPGSGRLAGVAVVMVVLAVGSGCGSDGATSDAAGTPSGAPRPSGAIVVSAAASLTDSFEGIRDDFVEAHPGTDVTLNVASSGALSAQIRDGAPADVAAFADTTPMRALGAAGLLAGAPERFARNQLTIVTRPGDPAGITGLADLADAGVISLCVRSAPCGSFAEQILADAGVSIPATSISRGTDARSTLAAVAEGDAVAGIVYVTDAAAAAGRVDTVDIPEGDNVVASYPIAVVAGTGNAALAEAFRSYVLSDAGQDVLGRDGFLAP